jgi:hypothetical protein
MLISATAYYIKQFLSQTLDTRKDVTVKYQVALNLKKGRKLRPHTLCDARPKLYLLGELLKHCSGCRIYRHCEAELQFGSGFS